MRNEVANENLRGTLQERALINLRPVGALSFAEDMIERFHTELSEQASKISIQGAPQPTLFNPT